MSNLFKTNILDPIYENNVLQLPYVKDGCNVVRFYKTCSGNVQVEYYKLTETSLLYWAFNQWNEVPYIEYATKKTCFYFVTQI